MVMAHECPECYQVCHCHGDIDDCQFDDWESYVSCVHHLTPDCDTHWEMEDDYDY